MLRKGMNESSIAFNITRMNVFQIIASGRPTHKYTISNTFIPVVFEPFGALIIFHY